MFTVVSKGLFGMRWHDEELLSQASGIEVEHWQWRALTFDRLEC